MIRTRPTRSAAALADDRLREAITAALAAPVPPLVQTSAQRAVFTCGMCGAETRDPFPDAVLPPDTTWRCFVCETDHPHPRAAAWPEGARLVECPHCEARQVDPAPPYVAQRGRPRKHTRWVERMGYCPNCEQWWPHPNNPGEWVSTLPERAWLVEAAGGSERVAQTLGIPVKRIADYLAGKVDLTPVELAQLPEDSDGEASEA